MGVLLPPELDQERGQDAVEDRQAMNQGVMGGAEGNQEIRPGDARLSMVNVEAALRAFPFPAHPAGVAVALEHPGAPSAEMEQVVPLC